MAEDDALTPTPSPAPEPAPAPPETTPAAEAAAPAPPALPVEIAAPPPSPTAALEAEVSELRQRLEQARNQGLRYAADLDNFRKRTRKEMQEAEVRGKEDVLQALIGVVDDVERAFDVARQPGVEVASIVTGLEMVLGQFARLLERYGIQGESAVGQPFDPTYHEALQIIETADHPAGTIVQEYRKAYRMGERLVRTAQVVVARPPVDAPPPPEPESRSPEPAGETSA
jgi:molecular chaperone GrpE